jgi:hypothetical protein
VGVGGVAAAQGAVSFWENLLQDTVIFWRLPKHTIHSFAKTDSVAKKRKFWHIIFKNKWS